MRWIARDANGAWCMFEDCPHWIPQFGWTSSASLQDDPGSGKLAISIIARRRLRPEVFTADPQDTLTPIKWGQAIES